jgi:hypothetical protein
MFHRFILLTLFLTSIVIAEILTDEGKLLLKRVEQLEKQLQQLLNPMPLLPDTRQGENAEQMAHNQSSNIKTVWPRCYLTNSYYHDWLYCPFGGSYSGGFSIRTSYAGVHYQNVWRLSNYAWLCCP